MTDMETVWWRGREGEGAGKRSFGLVIRGGRGGRTATYIFFPKEKRGGEEEKEKKKKRKEKKEKTGKKESYVPAQQHRLEGLGALPSCSRSYS